MMTVGIEKLKSILEKVEEIKDELHDVSLDISHFIHELIEKEGWNGEAE